MTIRIDDDPAQPTGNPRPRRQASRSPGIRDGAGPVEKTLKAIILLIACAMVVVPFIGIISTSIAPADQVTEAGGFVLFPGTSTSPPTSRSSPAASSPEHSWSASSSPGSER
ncbi:hypothetical protein [Brachybacterium sp. P6-10-X1]|uniref:hypothetical protein n=1 Tax=Brachybacterium sp. P6-10-X1 TaxID=1903186 RepID=UPI0020A44043|nr:hypothetical protein [Brachybacterium sp. P6-10-X1]